MTSQETTGAWCRCGRTYARSDWRHLKGAYHETDERGGVHEYRTCACGSSIEGPVVLTEEAAKAADAERRGDVEKMYQHLDAAQRAGLRRLMGKG